MQVAIINEALAAQRWPNQDPLGRRFKLSGESTLRHVVGVARTVNYQSLGEDPQPCLYLPLRQNFSDAMVLYVRTESDPTAIMATVQQELRAIDSRVELSDVRTIKKIVSQALFGATMGVGMLTVFGLLALGLASLGLYGAMAYSVSMRQREIGVRMALGAGRASVLGLVLRQGMTLVFAGIFIGLVVSLMAGRALSRILYGITPADPVSLAGASLIQLTIAAVACYLPAHRASRLDPLMVLR